MKKILILFLIFAFPQIANANVYQKHSKIHKHFEKEYQKYWCSNNNGLIEYKLPDKGRVDCVTETHAIEFDFASKWAEAIGQSLYYGNQLKKIPGIVLISENGKKDENFIRRLCIVAEENGITVWIITPKDIECKNNK